jgi:hypothetical protein
LDIEHTQVFGFQAAIRGMRNSRESWSRGDSSFGVEAFSVYNKRAGPHSCCSVLPWPTYISCPEVPHLGPNDLKLMKNLARAGSEHRKFLRQIQVWVDMTLPRYIWTEMDTYKVGTVRNSVSSMDRLGLRDLTQEDFQNPVPEILLRELNHYGWLYRTSKGKERNTYRIIIKNMLAEGFLMKSTMTLNYENIVNIYHQRKNHRLPEWNTKDTGIYSICDWILELPWLQEICL